MLTGLYIKNFAIIDRLELDLLQGLTVITGETGAGKSILIDALGLVLGDRAHQQWIRPDCERAEITAIFDLTQQVDIQNWLSQLEIDAFDECIIRRIITADGRSKAFINGHPFAIQRLKELGQKLVEIHGQHAQHSLLKTEKQRELLDSFGDHLALCQHVKIAYREWKRCKDTLDAMQSFQKERLLQLDYLSYQINELNELSPQPDEWPELKKQHKAFSHLEQVSQACNVALNRLEQDHAETILGWLRKVKQDIDTAAHYNDKLNNVAELINNGRILLEEATHELNLFLDNVSLDPTEYQQLETRINEYHRLASKHHVNCEELAHYLVQLVHEQHEVLNAEQRCEKLEYELEQHVSAYKQACENLTQARQQSAAKLSQIMTEHVQTLGMPHAQFLVTLFNIEDELSEFGQERIQFMFQANPGQPMMPLNKVVSGGELSRISLALEVSHIEYTPKALLIFDEIDVGIGGATAEIVGNLLHKLAQKTQILCVTHQPQVAAQGNHHIYIQKQFQKDKTFTRITLLSEEQRMQELARMLGGITITPETLAHAQKMLEKSYCV